MLKCMYACKSPDRQEIEETMASELAMQYRYSAHPLEKEVLSSRPARTGSHDGEHKAIVLTYPSLRNATVGPPGIGPHEWQLQYIGRCAMRKQAR